MPFPKSPGTKRIPQPKLTRMLIFLTRNVTDRAGNLGLSHLLAPLEHCSSRDIEGNGWGKLTYK